MERGIVGTGGATPLCVAIEKDMGRNMKTYTITKIILF